MDETVDVVFGSRLCNAFRTVNVNIGVREVPARLLTECSSSLHCYSLSRVLTANKVVNNIGVTNALLNGLGVPQVIFLGGSMSLLLHGEGFRTRLGSIIQ